MVTVVLVERRGQAIHSMSGQEAHDTMSVENASPFSVQESSVSAASVSEPAAPEMVLPEGYSVMFGEDGQQYVTVVQDDQTYAFPAEEFHQMQQASLTFASVQYTITV